jgi:hypothetical protein
MHLHVNKGKNFTTDNFIASVKLAESWIKLAQVFKET